MTEWTRTGLNPIGLKDVPAQFLAVQWNQDYTLIGVFWTLGIELHFYLVAPLLAMVLLLRTRWWPAIALIVYAGLTCWFEYAATNLGWSWDGRNIVSNLPHFFAGMLACAWGASLTRDRRWIGWLCVAGALGLLGYTNWLYNIHPDRFWSVRSILLTDALIVLLVVAHAHFATRERPLPVVARALGFLGTVSYGVYAWHGYVMNYVPWTADHVVVLSTVSVGLAYTSYRLLERPALARKKHPELRDDSSDGEVAVQAV